MTVTPSSNPSNPAAPATRSEGKKPALSLPKGGGALKGLNEKFSVDAFTGSASSAITLFTAPARLETLGGITLSYNSGSGNGPMGIGWSIGSPSVKRRTDKGVPKYGTSKCTSDIFIAPGTDDLVKVKDYTVGNWQVIRYRSRIEKSFSLVEQFVSTDSTGKVNEANSFWRVVSKENVTSVFGATDNGRRPERKCQKEMKAKTRCHAASVLRLVLQTPPSKTTSTVP